jgi:hypothetical protein
LGKRAGKRRDICEKIGAQRLTLAEFFAKGDDVVHDLLLAMQEAGRTMKPDDLGFLGKQQAAASLRRYIR